MVKDIVKCVGKPPLPPKTQILDIKEKKILDRYLQEIKELEEEVQLQDNEEIKLNIEEQIRDARDSIDLLCQKHNIETRLVLPHEDEDEGAIASVSESEQKSASESEVIEAVDMQEAVDTIMQEVVGIDSNFLANVIGVLNSLSSSSSSSSSSQNKKRKREDE